MYTLSRCIFLPSDQQKTAFQEEFVSCEGKPEPAPVQQDASRDSAGQVLAVNATKPDDAGNAVNGVVKSCDSGKALNSVKSVDNGKVANGVVKPVDAGKAANGVKSNDAGKAVNDVIRDPAAVAVVDGGSNKATKECGKISANLFKRKSSSVLIPKTFTININDIIFMHALH
jgi:hypothetical protein